MKKIVLIFMVSALIFPLWSEEGIELVSDPSLLEEVYQEFSLRVIQSLRAQTGSILVGPLTSNDYPLTATVMFQGVLLKELLISLPDFEIYQSENFRGNPDDIHYVIKGETYQEQDVIFISLKMFENSTGRILAVHNFTIPANARWGSSFIPQVSQTAGTNGNVDSYEPNNSVTAARNIEFPSSAISGSFQSSEDVDCFKFTLPEDSGETFVTVETMGATDTVMVIYGPDSMDLYHEEDDDSGNDYNAKISFPAQAGETWWIELKAYDAGGDYSLSVSAGDAVMTEDESNVDFSSAFPLGLGETMEGFYSYNDEGDYFLLNVTDEMAGKLLTISTDDQIDTELYIYDEQGIESGEYIYYNDDGQTYGASISFIPDSNSTLYIMLNAYDQGPYNIYLNIEDIPMDASEPNDHFRTATPIEPGDRLEQSFFHDMDVDIFVLQVSELRRYRIETQGSVDPIITLYDENQEYLDSDDDSGMDTNSLIRTYLEPGVVYIEVKSAINEGAGDYVLIVE